MVFFIKIDLELKIITQLFEIVLIILNLKMFQLSQH